MTAAAILACLCVAGCIRSDALLEEDTIDFGYADSSESDLGPKDWSAGGDGPLGEISDQSFDRDAFDGMTAEYADGEVDAVPMDARPYDDMVSPPVPSVEEALVQIQPPGRLVHSNLFGVCLFSGGELLCWPDGILGREPVLDARQHAYVHLLRPHVGGAVHGEYCMFGDGQPTQCRGRAGALVPPQAAISMSREEAHLSCLVATDGILDCWRTQPNDRTAVPRSPVGWFVQVSTRDRLVCGLKTDLRAVCWGADSSDLGGYYDRTRTPNERFRHIEAAADGGCGLTLSGDVMCWGQRPEQDINPRVHEGPFTYLSVSDTTIYCVIDLAQRGRCFEDGQQVFETPASLQFVEIFSAYGFGCGLTTEDKVMCWLLPGGAGAPEFYEQVLQGIPESLRVEE